MNNANKTIFLIAGANGSGKTTLAKELLKNEEGLVFLNSDEIALEIKDSIGINAGKVLLKRFDNLLSENKSIVIESTISGKHHFNIIKKARKANYQIKMIYVYLDIIELNIARIQNRVALGGHDVPLKDIVRRYKRSLINFWKTIEEVDFWRLYCNTDVMFSLIACGNKELNIINESKFNIFKRICYDDN